jgi:hypothetical protein
VFTSMADDAKPKRTLVSKKEAGSAVFPDVAAMDGALGRSQGVEEHLAHSARFRSRPTRDSTCPWAVSQTHRAQSPLSLRTYGKPPSLVGVFVAEPPRKRQATNYSLKSPFAIHDEAPTPGIQRASARVVRKAAPVSLPLTAGPMTA